MKVLLWFLVILNIYGFMIMGIDKRKAKINRKRIREKALFVVALLGGALGIYVGMRLFRHKTLHSSFAYGIPICIALNASVYLYIYSIIK